MNSSTFSRLALLLPYLPLIQSILYFVFRDISEQDSFLQTFNLLWNFLAIFWYVPYTLLVVYLLIWSVRKTSDQIFKLYKFAPVLLMFLAAGLYTILFLIGLVLGDDSELGGILMIFGIAAVVAVPASLILGYAFVGISLLLYKFFLRLRWVVEDELPMAIDQNPDLALTT